ncbi:solute carrier family 22 member 15-like isoform X2 [Myxocyprinus asiaticus]|uniref:solute carrier family 22 member 15-like isoform X2 n=1 Tax=Myxocyprinus asiaticus TaxID=70543 RepID=UPI00222386A6|nr:solute carrier family 22 member 15-like isoform X2 [Myxocyprinus asiaticus]
MRNLPESPRWLYSRGRTEHAEDILQDFAVRNVKGRVPVKLRCSVGASVLDAPSPGVLQMVTHPILRWRTVVLMYVWYSCSFVYYDLTLNASEDKGNCYLSVAMYGLVELPAYPLYMYFINKQCFSGQGGGSQWPIFLPFQSCPAAYNGCTCIRRDSGSICAQFVGFLQAAWFSSYWKHLINLLLKHLNIPAPPTSGS